MAEKYLYERATVESGVPAPFWHIDGGYAVFAGPLDYNAGHRHSVPVYIAGLYEPFRLRVRGEDWLTCRTAVIPAGTSYELDAGGNPLAVLYLEPSEAGVDALTPLVRDTREVAGVLIGTAGEISLPRELYEDRSSLAWSRTALDDLMNFSKARAAKTLDPRVSRAVASMRHRYDDLRRDGLMSAAEAAHSVHLSASRFQHLFTLEIGVPFRRYRAWRRLRAAIREIVAGSSFTVAAHAAGFADQAHFAHNFRRTFGAPASGGLRKARGLIPPLEPPAKGR